MLTLFKPWRTGSDLRPSEDTLWDEVFSHHKFTERQQQIMKFFHIKYECNDARDDFSAMRKQLEKGGKGLYYMSRDDLDEIDTQQLTFDNEARSIDREDDIVNSDNWKDTSRAEVLRQSRHETAQQIMTQAGWLDKITGKIDQAPNMAPLKINVTEDRSASDWRDTLAEARQRIMDARDSQAKKRVLYAQGF